MSRSLTFEDDGHWITFIGDDVKFSVDRESLHSELFQFHQYTFDMTTETDDKTPVNFYKVTDEDDLDYEITYKERTYYVLDEVLRLFE